MNKNPPPNGSKRRTVLKFILAGKTMFNPKDFLEFITHFKPSYSTYNKARYDQLVSRDKALLSFLVVSCARINEPLRIYKEQVDLLSDPDFILIKNFRVSKRKKGRVEFIPELPFTRKPNAILYPFSEYFLDYFDTVKDGTLIFPIQTRQARNIIYGFNKNIFPHIVRGCALSYFINTLQNPLAVSKIFGVKRVETLQHYYGKTWTSFKEELGQ